MKVPFLNLYKAVVQCPGRDRIAIVAAESEKDALKIVRALCGFKEAFIEEELPGRYQGLPGGTVLASS